MGKVTKSLLVCGTPRSGSTLLCALLDGTGVAGRPQEFFERLAHSGLPRQPREYFERVEDPQLPAPPAQPREYFERVEAPKRPALPAPTDPGSPDPGDPIPRALAEGTTNNGVF